MKRNWNFQRGGIAIPNQEATFRGLLEIVGELNEAFSITTGSLKKVIVIQ